MRERLIFVLTESLLSVDLEDTIREYFKSPDIKFLQSYEIQPHDYYKIAKHAAAIARKEEYESYYLLCLGPPMLIAIIAAKLTEAIGRFKGIEVRGEATDIRSLDIP